MPHPCVSWTIFVYTSNGAGDDSGTACKHVASSRSLLPIGPPAAWPFKADRGRLFRNGLQILASGHPQGSPAQEILGRGVHRVMNTDFGCLHHDYRLEPGTA
jgi:hypothetical protein